jgi:hypothetical protein
VSNDTGNGVPSGPRPSDHTKFLHIVMSYDSVEGKYSYQTLDDTALRHQPCGPTCDFDETLRAWQALPRSVKQAASKWVDDNFSHRTWHLHAALPIQKDIRTTRRLLQRAVLGELAHQGVASIMLVFSSTEKYVTSESGSTTGDSVSSSSDSYASMSDSEASRVDLSQADMEQMREWLTTKGLSAAKIAELEALVVRQKESAAAAAATKASTRHDQSSPQGEHPTDATVQADISRPGAASHVRFVSSDVAPSTRQKSHVTTVTSRRSNTYDRGHAAIRRPEPYQISTRDGLRPDYRDGSLPSPPHRPSERASDAPRNPFNDYRYQPATRPSSRRIDDTNYRVHSHQSAYDRQDYREPTRTRAEDQWEYRDRHPQLYRQYSHGYNTNLDPSRDSFLPPPRPGRSSSRSRDHRSRLDYELAETMPDRRRRSRARSLERGGSDTSSRSRGRHRSSERHVVRHRHMEPADSRRYRDHENTRGEAGSLGRPLRIIERTQPANLERREIITNPYSDYGLHQRIYPGSTQIPLSLDPDMFSMPRQLSPEPMADDASDAEDAELDDAELKNKMLVKYTGGTVANTPAEPGRTSGKSHGPDAELAKESAAGPGAEIDDEEIQWDSAAAIRKKKRESKKMDKKKRAKLDLELTPGLSIIEPASPDSQTVARPVSTSPISGVQVSRHHFTVTNSY